MIHRSLTRRLFIQSAVIAAGSWVAGYASGEHPSQKTAIASPEEKSNLPEGSASPPVVFPHFPSRMHAFVWRNWQLVPVSQMAKVSKAKPEDILLTGKQMGLQEPPGITADQQRRSYITVLRRNWHLLPYNQLLELLGWTEEQLIYTLNHDDGVFWKFGSLKPKCEQLLFTPEDEQSLAKANDISRNLDLDFPLGVGSINEPLFHFVSELSDPLPGFKKTEVKKSRFSPQFCYSYFAPFGDPLLDNTVDPYPDGYLARLTEMGVDGVWLHIELSKLAPFPWDNKVSEHHATRLQNLRTLTAKARQHGIGIYLYLNEPKTLPLTFFAVHPQLKGIDASNAWETGSATLCTSVPEVQNYLTNAVAHICQAVPDLAGFFTITASEALTSCWSHGGGAKCPRCSKRTPDEVIAEINTLYLAGIRKAGSQSQLIVWDWGWPEAWAKEAINRLPAGVSFMSVSEWNVPIDRGGIKSAIAEYSLSAVGPGPRAKLHWELARKRGLKTIAKIQANNSWELSAVPYIPAIENVAQHAANLRDAKIDGIMLGWSLGGYPSPNLEVVSELGCSDTITPAEAADKVARRRFGAPMTKAVVQAWHEFSVAFSEYPFGDGLYNTPTQFGPANLLWGEPTRYHSSPVGFPYDDLDGWRGQYPPEIFIQQFEKVAKGFETALIHFKQTAVGCDSKLQSSEREALSKEINVAEAAYLHFRSTANQVRFVWLRNSLSTAKTAEEAQSLLNSLEETLHNEIETAQKLYAIQIRDSRIGFEASNHYYYVPVDLAEKVLNCRDLLTRWLPLQRDQWQKTVK